MASLSVGFSFILVDFCCVKMSSGDYRVADISLADFGRKEVSVSILFFVSHASCFFLVSSHHSHAILSL